MNRIVLLDHFGTRLFKYSNARQIDTHGRMNHHRLIGDELRPRSVRRDERQSGKRYNQWLTVFSLLEERTHHVYH
jgi:hypothetical protein